MLQLPLPDGHASCEERYVSAGDGSRSAAARSGDEQAKAKLCRLEIEEITVAFGPLTRCEVMTEVAHSPLLGDRPDA